MTALLDVNLLLILHDPLHPHYQQVSRWFARRAGEPFATCPITESALVRLLARGVPGVAPYRMQEARAALENFVQLPGHVYWPDTPAYLDATSTLFARMQGHRQTTDAYLLGLAIHNQGKLATLDRGIAYLAGREFAANVEIIEF
jgi:hypothetical protein